MEFDRNGRAREIATSATLGALIDLLLERGVITRADAFQVFSLAHKGLQPFADDADVEVACARLGKFASGFTEER
jgi:hypothetical protein